jgi:hypothetical protein
VAETTALDGDQESTRVPGLLLWSGLAVAAAIVASACYRDSLDPGAGSEGAVEVALLLTQVPTDVQCIEVTVRSDVVKKVAFNATQHIKVTGLSAGVFVFTVEAFSGACGDPDKLSWKGGPVSKRLEPGFNSVSVSMFPVGTVAVSVDFDPNRVPVCAPVEAACVKPEDCCTMNCVANPASVDGIKKCGAQLDVPMPMPMPAGPSVNLSFDGGASYLFYSPPNGPGCNVSSTQTPFVVRVPREDALCLDPNIGDVIAIPIGSPRLCTAGGQCQPCDASSCGVDKCIAHAPLSDGACQHPLESLSATGDTYYLVVTKVGPNDPGRPPAMGLPSLFYSTRNTDIGTVPPDTQPNFVYAKLGTPVNPPNTGGDMCSGLGLCGIVKYNLFSGSPFMGWWFAPSFSATSLYAARPF